MGEYLYTDRSGMELFEGDIVRSFHSQFSDNAWILGTIVARGNIEWGASDTEYLTIEVIADVQKFTDSDGDIVYHRSTKKAGTTVHPACVEINHGGAVIELQSRA